MRADIFDSLVAGPISRLSPEIGQGSEITVKCATVTVTTTLDVVRSRSSDPHKETCLTALTFSRVLRFALREKSYRVIVERE